MTGASPDRLAFNSPLTGFPSHSVDLSSFTEYLRRQAPELLPTGPLPGASGATPGEAFPHGTTIVALRYPGGVLIAGDRRSTQGNMIAGRDVQKVYITDDYTATGIAGTAALLSSVKGITVTTAHDGLTLSCAATHRSAVLEAVLQLGNRVRNLQITEPSLEDMFFGLEH